MKDFEIKGYKLATNNKYLRVVTLLPMLNQMHFQWFQLWVTLLTDVCVKIAEKGRCPINNKLSLLPR